MKNTNRFTLDYDTTLEKETKLFILENCNASMVCIHGNSSQYCLDDVIDCIYDEDAQDDLDNEDFSYLLELAKEGVDYIEICW
jgi:hypothetical protein